MGVLTGLLDFRALTREARAWLTREAPAILATLLRSGADPEFVKLVNDLPVTCTVSDGGTGMNYAFATPERELAARALEYGSSTRHVPAIRLLSRLNAHMQSLIDRDMGAI